MSSTRSQPRVLLVVNADWYFWSHRLRLAKALQASGCEVVVAAAPERGYARKIEEQGLRFIPLPLLRRSTAIHRELVTLHALFATYRRERPDLVHHVTIKPVLYGSLVARAVGIPRVINAIPGLGYMFLGHGWRGWLRRRAASLGYRLALHGDWVRVIFQNPDDRVLFVSRGLVPERRALVLRGAGVDVDRFGPGPEPAGIPVVLLASRLLWDKGLRELIEATRRLKRERVTCRVVLVGAPDPENPKSVPPETIRAWEAEGLIEWWGLREDMPEILRAANLVVLPSYREGVPKILLEAAACGRAIVATDVPGCREIVRDGENGMLVPPRDVDRLTTAIRTLLSDPFLRAEMGARGRKIVVDEFSDEQVVTQTLAVYRQLLGDRWPDARA